MDNTPSSIFHNALQISSDFVSHLHDEQLNQLMERLFLAEAYRYKSPMREIRINTEIKAEDDGCDGWTAKPEILGGWLGSTNTCWQFKSGISSEPNRLKGEVIKKIPRETLAGGGRFVIIASGLTNSLAGEKARLKVLVKEAKEAGLPTEKIEVIGSDRLAFWCNQHPAVAAYFSGFPSSLWTFEKWSRSDVHRVPWQASETVKSKLVELRAKLDFSTGEIKHLHIHGLPGVGKTRFVLELCREAEWRNAVIYIPQAADLPLSELINDASNDPNVQLMVVADEVENNKLDHLRELIGQGNGRVRLITIGHGKSPDPIRIQSLSLDPLERKVMIEVIKGWHPAMPLEHVDFIVRFADGYVRLAWLASNAVARNPSMNVRELLNQDEIRIFLDRMLGTDNRQALHVVAVLSSIGWSGDKQNEGQVVAHHFNQNWNTVRYNVDKFHEKFGVAPYGGRYRYISPTPLGIYLAVEAWNNFSDILSTLPSVLPSDEAIDAYYERLQSMASNPYAQEFAREELNRFFRLDDFLDARAVRRWSAISAADPEKTAHNILHILIDTTIEDRKRITGDARRQIVWTLVRLAWKPSSFNNAVKALALLAEAENESWANNATGEFVDRFQIYLGGTAMPYQDRMPVLDDLMSMNRPILAILVVKALSKVGNRHWSRMESGPASDEVPDREWQPRTPDEYLECTRIAITRLCEVANLSMPELQGDLVATATTLSMLLRETQTRNFVADLFISIYHAYPQTREELRRIIAGILKSEKKYWKKIAPKDLQEIETLHAKFQESTLNARLLEFVGPEVWDTDEQPNLEPIAEELFSNPELLAQQWPWLSSGSAGSGWQLGEILAKIDTVGKLAEIMPGFPSSGQDLRLLCAYIRIQRKEMGDKWLDQWVKTQLQREPKPVSMLFEVVSRGGATEFAVRNISEILRNQEISPQVVGQLAYSDLSSNLSPEVLKTLLQALFDTGHRETAISILMHRIKNNPGEKEFWDSLALQLVTSPELIRSNQMVSFYWKEVASSLVPHHAKEIATAILREHVEHKSPSWFLDFSDAAPILATCLSQNPNESWNIIKPYLSASNVHRFTFGFPHGLIDRFPSDKVMDWVSKQPKKRAEILSGVLSLDFSKDDFITSQVIGKYGDDEKVAASFFSNYITGSWTGQASAHWDELADKLDEVHERTTLPKLSKWTVNSARYLRQMAERERQGEEEENVRRR